MKFILGALIWSLPLILLSMCGGAFSALVSEGGSDDAAAAAFSVLISCISIPYGLLVALLLPSLMGQLADHGDFGRAINPANAFRLLGANVGGYVIAFLIYAFVVPIINLIGVLLCLVGVLVAVPYGQAVTGHIYGQVYREAASGVDLEAPAAA